MQWVLIPAITTLAVTDWLRLLLWLANKRCCQCCCDCHKITALYLTAIHIQVAWGLIFGRRSVMQSNWGRLDVLIVVSSWVSFMSFVPDLKAGRALRTLRVLRLGCWMIYFHENASISKLLTWVLAASTLPLPLLVYLLIQIIINA